MGEVAAAPKFSLDEGSREKIGKSKGTVRIYG